MLEEFNLHCTFVDDGILLYLERSNDDLAFVHRQDCLCYTKTYLPAQKIAPGIHAPSFAF